DGVVVNLEKATILAPDNRQIILEAASLLTYFEKCTDSLNILDGYITRNEPDAEVYYRLSNSKLCLQDPVGAYDDLSTAIDLSRGKGTDRAEQAALLAKLAGSEKAFERFGQLIRLLENKLAKPKTRDEKEDVQKDLSWVYQMRARIHHSQGDTEAEFADL